MESAQADGEAVTSYLFGNPVLALGVTVLVACGIGLASSIMFTWGSNKSALWNMGFAIFLVVVGTAALLGVVAFLLSRVSY